MAAPRSTRGRLFGRDPLHPDARSSYAAAVAELEVGRLLVRLGAEFSVLHSVPVGDGHADIDHLVVGPPGVFTITTKGHAGAAVIATGQSVLVAGERTDYVRESVHEAQRAAELLRRASGGVVAVTPLIVVVGVDSIGSGQKPSVVTVLPAARLIPFLATQPVVMRADAIDFYATAAADRGTWQGATIDQTDDARHFQRFARLRQEVDTAHSRRMLWRVLTVVASAAAIALIAWEVVRSLSASTL